MQFTKSCTVRTVCDAYSIKGAWAAKYKNLSLERCEMLPPRSVRVKENVPVPENDLEQVLDIWCEGFTLTAFTEKENAAVRGKFTVCLLYRTKEKQIAYTERMLDFTDVHTAEIVGRRSVRGEITSVQYVITDSSTVECTAELRMEEGARGIRRAVTPARSSMRPPSWSPAARRCITLQAAKRSGTSQNATTPASAPSARITTVWKTF